MQLKGGWRHGIPNRQRPAWFYKSARKKPDPRAWGCRGSGYAGEASPTTSNALKACNQAFSR